MGNTNERLDVTLDFNMFACHSIRMRLAQGAKATPSPYNPNMPLKLVPGESFFQARGNFLGHFQLSTACYI